MVMKASNVARIDYPLNSLCLRYWIARRLSCEPAILPRDAAQGLPRTEPSRCSSLGPRLAIGSCNWAPSLKSKETCVLHVPLRGSLHVSSALSVVDRICSGPQSTRARVKGRREGGGRTCFGVIAVGDASTDVVSEWPKATWKRPLVGRPRPVQS